MTMGQTRTHAEIERIVNNLGYKLLKEYIQENNHNRRVVIQDEIGYKYDTDLIRFMRGHKPEFVSVKNSNLSLENISLWLFLNKSDFELCEGNTYKGCGENLKFYHNTCREYIITTWNSVKKDNCSICSGHQIGKYNNLAYKFPKIAREWSSDNNIKPKEVPCSSNQKVYWICQKCNYKWKTTINSRTRKNASGCPNCAIENHESKIATELKKWAKENFKEFCKTEYKIFRNPDTNYYLPFDIYIGLDASVDGIYIEIHWEQHYKLCQLHRLQAKRKNTTPQDEFEYNKKLDKMKRRFARKNGQYIEIDLRKIKTVEKAIAYIESKMK